jgi:hypothetical protein
LRFDYALQVFEYMLAEEGAKCPHTIYKIITTRYITFTGFGAYDAGATAQPFEERVYGEGKKRAAGEFRAGGLGSRDSGSVESYKTFFYLEGGY